MNTSSDPANDSLIRNLREVGATVCAWCQKIVSPGPPDRPVSHGICLECMIGQLPSPTQTLESMSQQELDELPFGAVRLSADGTILAYNKAESAISSRLALNVIGKRFFDEVAPCTQVAEFQGQYVKLQRAKQSGRAELDFVFRFATGIAMVNIVLLFDASTEQGTILVKLLKTESNG